MKCADLATYSGACIGAINPSTNSLATFSAYGNTLFGSTQGVASPVQTNEGTFTTAQGTSFAAPTAAGLYALYKQKYPNAEPKQILNHMKKTAITTSGGNAAGAGILKYVPIDLSGQIILNASRVGLGKYHNIQLGVYDDNSISTVKSARYELYSANYNGMGQVSLTSGLNYIGLIAANAGESITIGNPFNSQMEAGKLYFIKVIVDFNNGQRHWKYRPFVYK